MANNFGIPGEVESRLFAEYERCAYCNREMRRATPLTGPRGDCATIEHLNRLGPFRWAEGLEERHLVLACHSCNASRGTKLLKEWFDSAYCREKGVTSKSVAQRVRDYYASPASKV
jgi:hypothetical protein